MDDRLVRIHKTNLRANLNAVFTLHSEAIRQPVNWRDASSDQGMLERELTGLPDEVKQSQLVSAITGLLGQCKADTWKTCPPELLAKYVAS